MNDDLRYLAELGRRTGHVVSRQQLLAHGIPAPSIERYRESGRLRVVRRGWYALPNATAVVVAAVRAGAAVTCVSALPHHSDEIWVPPRITKTHLRWPPHRRRRERTHATCSAFRPLGPLLSAVDPLPTALLCAADCLPPDLLVAVLDSTLRMRVPFSENELHQIFDGAPRRITRLLGMLDPLAGSGTESITRYRLRCARIAVRSQVVIPGVGRVDLLIGDKLIVECDSKGHHSGAQRRVDNRRDRVATRGDYRILRIDYDDVIDEWDAVFDDIADIVRTDRHVGKVRLPSASTRLFDRSRMDSAS